MVQHCCLFQFQTRALIHDLQIHIFNNEHVYEQQFQCLLSICVFVMQFIWSNSFVDNQTSTIIWWVHNHVWWPNDHVTPHSWDLDDFNVLNRILEWISLRHLRGPSMLNFSDIELQEKKGLSKVFLFCFFCSLKQTHQGLTQTPPQSDSITSGP